METKLYCMKIKLYDIKIKHFCMTLTLLYKKKPNCIFHCCINLTLLCEIKHYYMKLNLFVLN